MQKIPVAAVVGATASGKTALAVELAVRFGGEIVSADSMQIYKGMNIATAKPTEEEKRGIPHHLLDFLPVTEKYSVARFADEAGKAIRDIHSRGKLPIVCGGTGLYVDSLLSNMLFEEEPDHTGMRATLEAKLASEGEKALYDELNAVDPEYAASLHMNNTGRVIRALEMYYLTGELPSVRRARAVGTESPYDPVYICIEYKNRENLYARIDKRVDVMFASGLEEEAREYFLLDKKSTASQAIGYKELAGYFNGEISLEEAADNLKRATRRYAKRQLTWFRRNDSINRIYVDELPDGISPADAAQEILIQKGFRLKE